WRCNLWRDVVSSRGSADGGSVVTVVAGSVDEGSDGGWSESGQVLLGVGRQEGRKGQVQSTRLESEQLRN
ncbi:hypothetical protein A2U01_0109200, partial [Trifolium medium]|nr:hypothetical protein [Trifolium medium]